MLLKCVGTCLNLITLSVPEVRVYFQTVLKELYKLILHILRIYKMYQFSQDMRILLVLCVITTSSSFSSNKEPQSDTYNFFLWGWDFESQVSN